MFPKPEFKEQFRTDISLNIKRKSKDFTINLFIADIEREAVMYSCEMILEFIKKSGGFIPPDWVDHIIDQVCQATNSLFKEFGITNRNNVFTEVKQKIKLPNIRQMVDSYYSK